MILSSVKFFSVQNKSIKVIFNSLAGISGALVILGTFTLPISFYFQFIILIILIFFISILNFYKLKRSLRVCTESCEYKGQWHLCPGFNEVYHNIRSINSLTTTDSNFSPYTNSPNP
jgi:hypothetical protein